MSNLKDLELVQEVLSNEESVNKFQNVLIGIEKRWDIWKSNKTIFIEYHPLFGIPWRTRYKSNN